MRRTVRQKVSTWCVIGLLLASFSLVRADDSARFSAPDINGRRLHECLFLLADIVFPNISFARQIVNGDLERAVDKVGIRLGYSSDTRAQLYQTSRVLALYLNENGQGNSFRGWSPEVFSQFLGTVGFSPGRREMYVRAFEVLGELRPDAFHWGQRLLTAGAASDLESLLWKAGMEPAHALEVVAALKALHSSQHLDLLTRSIVDQMFEARDEAILCVVGGGCRISEDLNMFAYYVPSPVNWNFVPQVTGQDVYPRRVNETGLGRFVEAIVIPRPEVSGVDSTAKWVATYVHEFTHWADIKLLSSWVRANQILINRGQEPDFLFRKYVRIVGDGPNQMIQIDHRFCVTFLETRAYHAMATTYSVLNHGSGNDLRGQNYVTEARYRAFAQINQEVGADVLNAYGVAAADPSEIFGVGQRMEGQIQATLHAVGLN